MKIKWCIILIISILTAGCQQDRIKMEVNIDDVPKIFPDYNNVTIPYNIAPLNFRVEEEGKKIYLTIEGRNQKTDLKFEGNKVIFPEKQWIEILKANTGDTLKIIVKVLQDENLKIFKPLKIFISAEPVDSYLVYRLLMPGFQNWNQMGIYQKDHSLRVRLPRGKEEDFSWLISKG